MKKVWAYTMGKKLSEVESNNLLKDAHDFTLEWTAHEKKLSANVSIVENCVLVFQVDEEVYTASGCSIDKLLRFIKTLEIKYNLELLNRFLIPVQTENRYEVLSSTEIKNKLENKSLSPESHILNTAISDEFELATWKQEIKTTWLNKYI